MSDLTSGRIPKANGPTVIGDSSISDTGSAVVFDSAVRSTYDGVGVIQASQPIAGFAITSNYEGVGEVNFWSLVNNDDVNNQGFYFHQKTAAGTVADLAYLFRTSTKSELTLFYTAGKYTTLRTEATSSNIVGGDAVPLNFWAGAAMVMTLTTAGRFILPFSLPPASATAAGVQGTIAWDANYIYVCTATNTWKRAAIATW